MQAARHGSYGMDMLVVVGTSVSYLYSTLSLLLACFPGNARHGNSHPHLFLESPAMLLTFISLGEFYFMNVLMRPRCSHSYCGEHDPDMHVVIQYSRSPSLYPLGGFRFHDQDGSLAVL